MTKKASPLFGKINAYAPSAGKKRVEIYILLDQSVEHMQVGIAIDASASMKSSFAAHLPKAFRQPGANIVEPVVRHLARFVCNYTGDGTVLPIYWAVGPGGKAVEPIGRLDAAACETLSVEGPARQAWGTGTKLLPALDYYLKEFTDAEWAILLIITDGVIEDLEEVKARTIEVGWEIVKAKQKGKVKNWKFVIVGVGPEVSEAQLAELDDMFEGTELGESHNIDLWDSKLAVDMTELNEIWEEADFGIVLPGSVRITDDKGRTVLTHTDAVPQRIEFFVAPEVESVTVELAGNTIIQPLT